MSKVYVIYYNNAKEILVGSGGTVQGNNRVGYHLPGGTVEYPHTILSDQDAKDGAIREVGEEFGTDRGNALKSLTNSSFYISRREYGGAYLDYVYIIAVWLRDNLIARMIGEVRDGKNDQNDSAFSHCSLVGAKDAVANFKTHGQDWFVDGVIDWLEVEEDEEYSDDSGNNEADDYGSGEDFSVYDGNA